MSIEEKEYLKKLAQELSAASHQSRDKEVSGLFREIKNDIESMKKDLSHLEDAVYRLEESYTSFDKKSVKYDLTTQIVFGIVTLMLTTLVGALIGLVIL